MGRIPKHDRTWVRIAHFQAQFPSYSLEGKLKDKAGSIDKFHKCYVRRKKREVREEVENF